MFDIYFQIVCFSPVSTPFSDQYQFDGTGFVEMPELVRFSDSRFSVLFKFKAFWGDALLFYAENKERVCILYSVLQNFMNIKLWSTCMMAFIIVAKQGSRGLQLYCHT